MQKNIDWNGIKRTQVILTTLHPELFSLENPVPFKIGIHDDLKARFPDLKWYLIRGLFRWLTKRRAYLVKCTEGADRMGFDGPCGVITASAATHAQEVFAVRNASAFDPWPSHGA